MRCPPEQIIGKLRIHELGKLLAAFASGFGPARESEVEFVQELERTPLHRVPEGHVISGARRISEACAPRYVATSGSHRSRLARRHSWGREGQSPRLIGNSAGLLPSQHDSDRDC